MHFCPLSFRGSVLADSNVHPIHRCGGRGLSSTVAHIDRVSSPRLQRSILSDTAASESHPPPARGRVALSIALPIRLILAAQSEYHLRIAAPPPPCSPIGGSSSSSPQMPILINSAAKDIFRPPRRTKQGSSSSSPPPPSSIRTNAPRQWIILIVAEATEVYPPR